jgi:hypothetical protein
MSFVDDRLLGRTRRRELPISYSSFSLGGPLIDSQFYIVEAFFLFIIVILYLQIVFQSNS